ncbi:hypothetical protein VNO78_09252 [Psophocarpus tetragonolobus]|uniref:Uncharacterized protein n=1 Tax=Psophocarpus tetragonolobus TaxID=3891 RepID=A0AAN9SW59_PSOTE
MENRKDTCLRRSASRTPCHEVVAGVSLATSSARRTIPRRRRKFHCNSTASPLWQLHSDIHSSTHYDITTSNLSNDFVPYKPHDGIATTNIIIEISFDKYINKPKVKF